MLSRAILWFSYFCRALSHEWAVHKSINNKNHRMKLKEKLSSECIGIILDAVKEKCRKTILSDECGINRKYFNRKMFRLLRFHRVVNLLYSMSSWMSREEFVEVGKQLFGKIWDFCSKYDDEYYDETRR